MTPAWKTVSFWFSLLVMAAFIGFVLYLEWMGRV